MKQREGKAAELGGGCTCTPSHLRGPGSQLPHPSFSWVNASLVQALTSQHCPLEKEAVNVTLTFNKRGETPAVESQGHEGGVCEPKLISLILTQPCWIRMDIKAKAGVWGGSTVIDQTYEILQFMIKISL